VIRPLGGTLTMRLNRKRDMTRYYVEYINEDKIQDVIYLYAPSQIFVQSIMSDYKIIAIDQTD
jgi:hypothetical protein